jgi:hypothetical protein
VNLLLKEDRVVALTAPPRFRLDLIREVRGSHESLVGALGRIEDLADPGVQPLLVNEFARRQEIIQEGAPGTVDAGEGLMFCEGIEAAVADILPNAFKVFLFDETVIVFLVGPGSGKGDMMGIAPGQEGPVDGSRALSSGTCL